MEKYIKEMQSYLKRPFDNVDRVDIGYGDLFQDMFVLSVLNGKENGTYLEIGGAEPIWMSNTYILEKHFNWKGISVEIELGKVNRFNQVRSNHCICENALNVDYRNLLRNNKIGPVVDYLSIDIEPPEITFAALKAIPHDELKFRVITFEHDLYTGGHAPEVRIESRKFLTDLGYKMIVNDVSSLGRSVEDWYVHTDLVSSDIIDKFTELNNQHNDYYEYFLNGWNK